MKAFDEDVSYRHLSHYSSYLSVCFGMVSFRGQIKPEPLPDSSLLATEVQFKFSDQHPRPFHMVPPSRSPRC